MSSDYSSRARLFHDALYDALAGEGEALPDAAPLTTLRELLDRCRQSVGDDETAAGALDAFEAIVGRPGTDEALSEAASLFESPQRFRDALFFLRCLDRDPDGALALMRHRAYLSAAVTPSTTHAGLATEQAALLDATTFETLWTEPQDLTSMQASIQAWRHAYQPVYTEQHAAYNHHLTRIVEDIEAAQWQTEALEKLNRLERLGEPVAVSALARFHDLEAQAVCHADVVELAAELAETPVCPFCAFRLGDVAPVELLNTALVAIERGLATQRSRLGQRVVSRLLARPGRAQESRLDRFIAAVQANDLAGLAQILDEGLLEFLGDLLQTPEPRTNLIDRLAHDFPEVTDERVEDVVTAFRRLLQEELQQSGGRIVIGREDDA